MLYTDEAIAKRIKKEKKLKKILEVLVYIVLIPLLTYNFSLIIQAMLNPRETPSFWGIKTYVIISGSMQPELEIGDIVIVEDTKELKEGDVISFREGQNIITHRITKIFIENEKKIYKTKGDNNNSEDNGTISEDLIEGKVINKIPELGKVAIFLQGKTTIITLLICLYIYICYSGELRRKKEERKLKRIKHEKKKKEN